MKRPIFAGNPDGNWYYLGYCLNIALLACHNKKKTAEKVKNEKKSKVKKRIEKQSKAKQRKKRKEKKKEKKRENLNRPSLIKFRVWNTKIEKSYDYCL